MNPNETIYRILSEDPLLWGKTYFPHHFGLTSADFHFEMMDDAVRQRFLAVAAPRESSKSTLLVFIYPFHEIVFKRKRFILIVSNTFKKAAMHLDTMKKEVRDNMAFSEAFGHIEISKDAEGDSVFRHPDGFETKVLCKGVDQIGSVRGVKFGANRPDLIILDDVEDDEMVKNPMRRTELKSEFDEALVPAGEKGKCQYIIVGTIMHDDSLLAKLVSKENYTEYHKLFFKAHLDADGPHERSLWPEKWSVEDLRKLMRQKPGVYAKEYQNDPVAGKNVRFRKEDFRYYRIDDNNYSLLDAEGNVIGRDSFKNCKAAIACDLAWKEKRESDSTVIMPGFLTPKSEILLFNYIVEKGMRPNRLAEYLFSIVARLEAMTGTHVPVGFEKAMLEQVTKWVLKNEMRKRGKFLVTKELIWEGDKEERVDIRLSTRYAQHVIFHLPGMGDLEHQLTRFPYGTKDDLVDAEQGLVQLLQYPKQRTVDPEPEDWFMKLRKMAIDAKKPKQFSGFGRKRVMRGIPFIRGL